MKSDFTVLAAVLLCLLGFGVGVFGTLVGAGGGFILTPVLHAGSPTATRCSAARRGRSSTATASTTRLVLSVVL
jgi:uncharacterized membrane protein YfcA